MLLQSPALAPGNPRASCRALSGKRGPAAGTLEAEPTVNEISALDVVVRWFHIGSVIVLVGGAFFLRFVLIPAAEPLPTADHDALRARVTARWRYLVHTLIALILISGFYTVIVKAKATVPLWHMLVFVKILLAMVIFFFASALVGRSAGLESFRKNPKPVLLLNLVLALLIVMISGVLRALPPKKEEPRAKATGSAFSVGGAAGRHVELR